MRCLIVTADDFGAAPEVNDAVEAAHRNGILSATSLMVCAPAADDAIARAHRLPSLRVGLHLVLTQGRPMLPASAVSQLVDRDGRFRSNLTALGVVLGCSSRARRQLAAEITAQFAAFHDSGLTLDHCNAHQHFHLHPLVGEVLASVGRRFGVRAVRVPLEPLAVLRKVEPGTSRASSALTLPFALALRRRLRNTGLATADRVFGLKWSGHMTRSRLLGLIRNLPPGLSEIYMHPATGPFPGAAPGYHYASELEALVAPEVVAACRTSALRVGGFGDFLESGPASAAQLASHGGAAAGGV